MSKFFALAIFVFASFACHADAKSRPYFSVSYADWDVVCDNVNHCEAITLGDSQGLQLSLVRDAGPSSHIRIRLTGSFADKAFDHLYVDDHHTVFENFIWQEKILSGEFPLLELSNENESDITHFLRIISAHTTLSIQENATSKKYTIPLIGLNESLLAIDELQGRKKNQTALTLTAYGKNPRTKVPAAPKAPSIKAIEYKTSLAEKETKKLIEITRKNTHDKHCSYDDKTYSDHAYALSMQKALVMLECDSGAYNISHRVFLISRQKKSVLIKPITLPSLPGTPDIHFLINADYDADTGILSQFRKYRGLSDCGNKARWAFDGVKFNLLEYREYELCKNGIHFEFPRLWHADVFRDKQ
jgi:uncharacterized protein Usg